MILGKRNSLFFLGGLFGIGFAQSEGVYFGMDWMGLTDNLIH